MRGPISVPRTLALVAGGLDFCTGAGLVALPAATLSLMRVPRPGPGEIVFIRFIGSFVASVGATYLWALIRPEERLRVVLAATAIIRAAVGSFVAAAVGTGWLPWSWGIVALTDGGLAAAQIYLVMRGSP